MGHPENIHSPRSVMNEVEAKEKASDAAAWLANLKKLLQDARAAAIEDMKQDHTETMTRPGKSPGRKSKKQKKKKREEQSSEEEVCGYVCFSVFCKKRQV